MSKAIRNPAFDYSGFPHKKHEAAVRQAVAAIPADVEYVTFDEIRRVLPDIAPDLLDGVLHEILGNTLGLDVVDRESIVLAARGGKKGEARS